MNTKQSYRGTQEPSWCKGCSFYSVLSALTSAFAQLNLDPSSLNVISGIGCSSRLPLYLRTFGMHTLHGRAIPVAIGARLTNPEIPALVVAGDGDIFSIGVGHFVHAARKNFNITVLCLDNRMYAMTKNQASPTSSAGYKGTLTPYGKISIPLNVLEFAISCEAAFVSRTFAGDPEHASKTIVEAISHSGFSFVEIISPCRTFESRNEIPLQKKQFIDINGELDHNYSDRSASLELARSALDYDTDSSAKIPIGIFWKEDRPTFESRSSCVQNPQSSLSHKSNLMRKFTV